ncbi:MAG: hypothetical protein ACQKBY_06080 [Verrucomicrobiales bacterium]
MLGHARDGIEEECLHPVKQAGRLHPTGEEGPKRDGLLLSLE